MGQHGPASLSAWQEMLRSLLKHILSMSVSPPSFPLLLLPPHAWIPMHTHLYIHKHVHTTTSFFYENSVLRLYLCTIKDVESCRCCRELCSLGVLNLQRCELEERTGHLRRPQKQTSFCRGGRYTSEQTIGNTWAPLPLPLERWGWRCVPTCLARYQQFYIDELGT